MIYLTCIQHGTQTAAQDIVEAVQKALEPEKWCKKCQEVERAKSLRRSAH